MEVLDISKGENIPAALSCAINCLAAGDIFIYPTDTIYGIGCDALIPGAIDKIIKVKKRNEKKQFIVLVDSRKMLEKFAIIDDISAELIGRYWPGPLTLIFKIKSETGNIFKGDDNKIAVRMPDNDFCLDLIHRYNKPVISTSANIHLSEQGGFNSILETFKDDINLFIYNGEVKSNLPSTLVDATSGEIVVLRQGVIKI